jgi:hypothetical protein
MQLQKQITIAKLCLQEIQARLNYFYYKYEPASDKHKAFHLCGKKIRILTGSPRTGKTTESIWDTTAISGGEHPVYKYPVPNIGWVVVPKFHKVFESGGMVDKFKEIVPPNKVSHWNINKNDNIYELFYKNGSSVVFKSQEQGVDSFTSNKVHWILVDERLDNHDIRIQLRSRIIDQDGLLIYTMDRLEDDEWVDDLKDKPYVSVTQLCLRDNAKYLPKEELERLETELDEADKEKIFYGNFKDASIEFLYKKEMFNEKNYVPETPKRFDIIHGDLVPSELGDLRIYKEPLPGVQYVMAWDAGEGVGQNPHAVQVFEEYGEQVATYLNNTLNYSLLAETILTPLGMYYNTALAVGELRGAHAATVMDNILKSGYPNIYVDIENKRIKQIKSRGNLRFGVVTDEINKPNMVALTWNDLKTAKILLHDEYTVIQLQHFVKDIKGKNKTKSGIKHHGTRIKGIPDLKFSDDDLVMALFFADRALNAWDYLKPRVKEVVTTIDRFAVPKVNIIRQQQEETEWWQ